METVLIVGATGNIGVSAVKAVLQTGRHVLAAVRNQASAEKLFHHVGTKEGITTVEADVCSEDGVQGIVDSVKAGKLPAFQHVYAAAGGGYSATPLQDISTEELRQVMTVNFESNFWAYRATIPYLLAQKDPRSTWTLCTGSQGDLGARAPPAMTQGALYSMANVACRDNYKTNVRFNEIYLALRVEVDESAAKTGAMKASDFAKCYVALLSDSGIRSSRVSVSGYDDLEKLKYDTKVKL
ncbi:hypothetical protein TCE0_041f13600 [Talaromyces pinophilus]|uniref:Uncharacterized protein n=1 Tax=Talaromyces pinophilus TaxID=128442 RepID=A0A6V8HJK6_TALPI|nr:Short-chain dehydrogenase/reductase SDR [Penicillium occitanis (nom. inval.)]PCH03542.1 hypothetical protein PENOC_038410 [Penicillium occitanis (nom. inval.)]GAM40894.1 hypothetical protein TCE0_041f13600 [Talaromyces pinophilus]